jgi:uncharacterized membrane protein YkvA (DUF1232 family)
MFALIKLRRFIKSVGLEAVMLFFALRHAATPRAVKIGAMLLALYVFSPIDVIPDVFGPLGWADDIAILTFGIPWLLKRVPEAAMQEIRTRAEQFAGRFGFSNQPPRA